MQATRSGERWREVILLLRHAYETLNCSMWCKLEIE
jgi:hypothetical protein